MKNVLIIGGRSPLTLDISRSLNRAGHRIFVADCSRYHISRFSNCVEKSLTLPKPKFSPEKFLDALFKEIRRHRIDLLIPTSEEIMHLARYREKIPSRCLFQSAPFETLASLHNKWLFYQKLQELGFPAPKTALMTSSEQLQKAPFPGPYIIKACYSRASQNLFKIPSGPPPGNLPLSSHNPWIAQEWLEGSRFCSYSIAFKGHLQAHAAYPVEFSIDKSSCLTFSSISHEKIYNWVKKFVEALEFTGQIAFDFIEAEEGRLYAIECNPRSTSGLYLLSGSERFAEAFLEEKPIPTIFSEGRKSKQIGVGMLLYGWRKKHSEKALKDFFSTFLQAKDIVYDRLDLKPFFSQPLLFAMYLFQSLRLGKPLPASFTHDFDWNGEKS